MLAGGQLRPRWQLRQRWKFLKDAVKAAVGLLVPSGRDLQRLAEVGDEVQLVLNADREANKVVWECALLCRNGGMAHGAGHLTKAVHAAKRDGHLEDPASLEKAPGEVHVARGKADHGALAPALRAVDLQALLAAAARAREEDLFDLRMLQQELANLLGVLLCALHSQVHGLDAPQEEEALEGGERRALGVLQEGHAVRQAGVAHADEPAGAVRVAREELRRRVHCDVDPQRQGLADDRGHHGAVDAQQHAVAVRQLGERPEVRDAHPRVGWALSVDQLCLRRDRFFDGLEVGGVHKGNSDAVVHDILRQQAVHAPVDVRIAEDLVA
mmetsp:Transcript_97425/g.236926  ORF Transcript_97425/g.236926 Transcript_97425/m.236926 type:complete len:327 (-) Transcript_97425:75-1055(-)